MKAKKLLFIIASIIITAYFIEGMKIQRGYKAVGGEWLIPILIYGGYIFFVWIKNDILDTKTIKEVKK